MLCIALFSPKNIVAFVVQVFYAYRISALAKSKAVAILILVVNKIVYIYLEKLTSDQLS